MSAPALTTSTTTTPLPETNSQPAVAGRCVEVWKPIPGYEGRYEVSDLGRVRRTGRWLRCGPGGGGQRRVRTRILALAIGGRANNYHRVMLKAPQRHAYVHHLVLETFTGERPVDMVGCHRNDDGFDNRLANLYWGTNLDNLADKARNAGKASPVEAGDDVVPF